MEQLPIHIILKKEKGELISNSLGKAKLKEFIDLLEEGARVEVTYEPLHGNASYAQLSKIHKCIREISRETGNTFEQVKTEVKRKAGLFSTEDKYKSFADCSKEEVDTAINTALDIADLFGINLHG